VIRTYERRLEGMEFPRDPDGCFFLPLDLDLEERLRFFSLHPDVKVGGSEVYCMDKRYGRYAGLWREFARIGKVRLLCRPEAVD
jgi:hypothetical protein